MTKKTFDARLLDHPPRPKQGSNLLFDTKTTGLAMRIPHAGTPAFQVIARTPDGREKRTTFAKWVPNGGIDDRGNRLSLDEIRAMAAVVREQIISGNSAVTSQVPAERSQTFTLREALELHIESGLAKGDIGLRTEKNYRDTARVHLSAWLDMPLRALSREAMREIHLQVGTTCGRAVANNVARVVSACWNRARRQFPDLPESPTANVDPFRIDARDYGLREHNVGEVWASLDRLDPLRADFYRTLLFTGLRRTSAAELRLQDVDLASQTLFIANPKGGARKAFTLPICNQLHRVLVARVEASKKAGSPWLFPAGSKTGHLVEPKAEGVPPPHAFRKLYASVAGNMLPHYPLKKLLNHSEDRRRNAMDVTADYVRLSVPQLRPHAQAVGDQLWELIEAHQSKHAAEPSSAREDTNAVH